MTANQTSFDGSQLCDQVIYAFKNRSIVISMPPQFQQQNAMMGMQPMMYGGMGCMPGMGMGMQGMNFGATNFSLEDDDGEERKRKKKKSNKVKVVDIDLSNEKNGTSSASVSDDE